VVITLPAPHAHCHRRV